jgi:hypothetical protein
MSYALVVYTISRKEFAELIGSGDLSVLDEIEESDAAFLDETDEIYQDDWEEDIPSLTARQAVEHLLNGGPYREYTDGFYIYAFEALCRVRGSWVDNRAFQPPIGWGWIMHVDHFLASIAFPLRVAQLAGGTLPFDFPHNAAPPSIGHWPHEPLASALDLLLNYRLDGLDTALAEALASIIGWLDEALKQEDDIIIGIYS